MSFTIDKIKSIMEECANKLKIPYLIRDNQITFNNLKDSWGECEVLAEEYENDINIYSLNKFIFANDLEENLTESQIINIIKHEFAHYYLFIFRQMNCGHGKNFRKVCKDLKVDNNFIGSKAII